MRGVVGEVTARTAYLVICYAGAMMMTRTVVGGQTGWAVIGLALMLSACGHAARTQPVEGSALNSGVLPAATTSLRIPAELSMPDLINRMNADVRTTEQYAPCRASLPRLDRLEALTKLQVTQLQGIDFNALDQDGRVDYLLMRNDLRSRQTGIRLERERLSEISAAIPFASRIIAMEEARARMSPVNAKDLAAELTEIEKSARTTLDDIRAKKGVFATAMKPVAALRAASACGQLRSAMLEYVSQFESYDPEIAWWCGKPRGEAVTALDNLAKELREAVAQQKGEPGDPLIGESIGREALMEALRDEMVAYTPEELIAIADREMAWCRAEFIKAAGEMGLGQDWKAAIEKVKNIVEPPGKQAEYSAAVCREMVEWLHKRDLVTIPPMAQEMWKTRMLSAESQRVLPFQAYGDHEMLVAYPTSGMTHADKLMAMRGNNKHFTRLVVPHEMIPGHHLQRFYADRTRPYRGQFSTPFYVEGWALYWEMREWELGWARGPEDRIGMLFWRAHRCARIKVSLAFHLNQMSPEQMVDFLVAEVGHERANAVAEVRRYINGSYSPLYQCGYMIGGLQLRQLHSECVESGKMSEKQFHDAVLQTNTMPMEMVRALLLKSDLKSAGEAEWKWNK